MVAFSPYEILNRKRRGEALEAGEIAGFIDRFTAGEIPDYQMSALLMAIAIQGANSEETLALTRALLASGESWQIAGLFDFIADKHSTGGVGDKVSLVLAPWVAACGVKVGMLSGRGLGHTGGTLDKLDSIPGFRARLTKAEFEQCVEDVGCVIATSTEGIAPADRRLYALRDVTGTVESIPLITASIMSKKLALGASALILDVKMGNGAFCRDLETARALTRSLIEAAAGSETRIEAMITDMSEPLGVACGNANEVSEAFEVLAGRGPADVTELTRAQAARILVLSGRFDESSALRELDEARSSGRALEQGKRWLAAQGADPESVVEGKLPVSRDTVEIRADRGGFISKIDAYGVGMLAIDLGCGRRKQDDVLDHGAGIMLDRKTGDQVRDGDVIARIQIGKRAADRDELRSRMASLIAIGSQPPPPRRLIYETFKQDE